MPVIRTKTLPDPIQPDPDHVAPIPDSGSGHEAGTGAERRVTVVPSSAGGLVGLLLILAPGIWYELIRQRSRPGRGDSAFVEVSRILLAGVLVSLTALILLGIKP